MNEISISGLTEFYVKRREREDKSSRESRRKRQKY